MVRDQATAGTRTVLRMRLATTMFLYLQRLDGQTASAFQSLSVSKGPSLSTPPRFPALVHPNNAASNNGYVPVSFRSGKQVRQKRTGDSFNNSPQMLMAVTDAESEKNVSDGAKTMSSFGVPGSDLLKWFGGVTSKDESTTESNEYDTSVVERYFDAWNCRDMDAAIECFADDCTYEDTQYPNAFSGKDALRRHLYKVADALPSTFEFVVDDIAISSTGSKIGVQWHVENDGEQLPFTRGCSFYTTDKNGLIKTGFDVPEPAVIKPGGAGLNLLSLASKLVEEPIRAIPLLLWGAYMYIVFFSDGILPGANALQLEQRTWEEVRDLSINFFLVSPLLHLPFSPVVHPMLEGIFNLLLSWAAMFAGFLSDERERKQNQFSMFQAVVGMQFLTSAFLLPYLALRTTENLDPGEVVCVEELGDVERNVGEWRGLGLLLGSVGTSSILWGLFGRQAQFGGFSERYASLIDLLSIDRVGSSFVVDLIVFGLFQGWLVDDDMRRRGVRVDDGELMLLRTIAKFIPFFGLATYLTLRPALPTRNEIEN